MPIYPDPVKNIFYLLTATVLLFVSPALAPPALAQVDARMLRQPDVSGNQITFVYAGDIWLVEKTGGVARRLSSPPGEESFPRFSPDGARIAFSGNYDGNADIYVVSATGGQPARVTHHPMNDRLLDWYPDGRSLLYASAMESGSQRYNQLYRTDANGGMPEKLPIPYGEFGAISPDGTTLAYIPISRDFRTWKRYRGGMAPDIWLFDLETFESKNVTHNAANDTQPMWHGSTMFFLSDRDADQRYNLFAYDLHTDQTRQVTHFTDFDVHFPAIGPEDIVFEAGGGIHLLDLATESVREIDIDIVTDYATLKPRAENVGERINSRGISPSGKRAVFEARGDVFTVPAEHGVIRNLTRSSGVAERYPAWSPDGESVAYFTDRAGEYELAIRPANGSGEEQVVTDLGPGFRYNLHWSPDSKKLVFIDQAMQIHLFDLDTEDVTQIDQGLYMFQGALASFRASWSPDSRWIAYDRELDNRSRAVMLYDTKTGERQQVTSGFYRDTLPVFDPDGDYLYFLSNRTLQPSYGDVDNSWIYANTTNIVAVPLREDVKSPLAPRNDEEGDEDADEDDEDDLDEDEEDDEDEDGDADDEDEHDTQDNGEGDEAVTPVEIELDHFENRLVVLPPPPGNYAELTATSGKVVYLRRPRTGSADENSPIIFYDLEAREERTILADAESYEHASNGEKLLVIRDGTHAIVDLDAGQEIENPLRTSDMEMTIDPMAEWKQIFSDVWRFQRDFFYDADMHGVDWEMMRQHYGALLDDAVTRWDVNYVIGELIAELNASHAYRGGGDTEEARARKAGLLGVDWELKDGAYRISHIVEGAPWDTEVRSPLAQPGISIEEGDYVLAVNGALIEPDKDPWAALQGHAGHPVMLTVSDTPAIEDAWEVLVEPLEDETRLRNLEWIEENRLRVEEATDGRVGYVYVPDTGVQGQTELVRQFAAQFTKEALIIDERFNSGGQIPDRFIELLNRPALAYWAVRDGQDWQWPPVAHFGPKVMLINGWSGSGGDAFPYYFREAELGPIIGTRTWGGLIGITGAPPLIDGGIVTVPTFRMYSPDGEWFAEGYGVEPDIQIVDDPTALANGIDPQLERAIEETLRLLEDRPARVPTTPQREVRIAPAAGSGR